MARAFLKTGRTLFFISLLLACLLGSLKTLANESDPFTSLSFDLGLEIGNEEKDFADAGLTVEKGRFLTYQIQLENQGSHTLNQVRVLMEPPDYLQYVPQSTLMQSNMDMAETQLPDVEANMSPLALGYEIEMLPPQKRLTFTLQYQVLMDISEDPAYTLAWAHAWSPYSVIPIVTQPIETVISGEAKPALQVEVVPSPPEGQSVNSGFFIEYLYKLHNASGLTMNEINLASFLPNHTQCIEGCGTHNIGTLKPNEKSETVMLVQVSPDTQGASAITHIGYDLFAQAMEKLEYRKDLLHPLDGLLTDQGGFIVTIDQSPDLILNAEDEATLRSDEANQTKTTYLLNYSGRHRTYTYPAITPGNPNVIYDCKVYAHPHPPNAQFYAYNSEGGACENLSECPIVSSPVLFNVETQLPQAAPRLIFDGGATSSQKPFPYAGKSNNVNSFIKNGEIFSLPDDFTLSYAVQNGLAGLVHAVVSATVNEDLWQYRKTGQKESIGQCSCGDECSYTVYRDIYRWDRVSRVPFKLKDEDQTDISVYTSTAWLKTQGGHIGTNGSFTHGAQTLANYVSLGINPVETESHLTPSGLYSPLGQHNADYMVFAGEEVGQLKQAHQDADWVQTGVEFPFLTRGEAYDREIHPRNYTQDLLEVELYAPVEKEALSSPLVGTVDLGDNTVIHHSGDLVIGKQGSADPVFLMGGQVRIYVEGNVYIYSDVFYKADQMTDYSSMPSVRIDAENIYVAGSKTQLTSQNMNQDDGAVQDLELMLLARDTFYSGKSHQQLRVLGDVIAKKTVWERQPLLQAKPSQFNQASEYVIEDLRKYVLPAPGDSQLPYNHTTWRQVNPATGEIWDNY